MPEDTKTIMSIWSFKRKRYPDGTLNKHKARLCAHGGMQTWGQNYWETYAPVVNWASVAQHRLALVIVTVQVDVSPDLSIFEFEQPSDSNHIETRDAMHHPQFISPFITQDDCDSPPSSNTRQHCKRTLT